MSKQSSGNSSSQVARRREQLKRQQSQSKQIQQIATVLAIVVVVVIGYFILQAVRANQAGDETAGSSTIAPAGTLLSTDRPLAAISPAERNNYYSSPPAMTIDTAKSYQALIQTSKGDMLLNLFDNEAPLTVNNFVFLASQGFYDGVIFHRVLAGFMAQGGDPTGTGTGGPGYSFSDETSNGLVFDRRGLLAMANSGPNTNGSQFFITFGLTDWLNGNHTIFGELVEGDGVLSSLTLRDPDQAGQPAGDTIERIDIYEQ